MNWFEIILLFFWLTGMPGAWAAFHYEDADWRPAVISGALTLGWPLTAWVGFLFQTGRLFKS